MCIVHIHMCTMHIEARGAPTLTDPRIAALEVELSLLARHHLRPSEHSGERLLDRSGYHLLGRLELGPLTLKQLAETFRVDPSTVNRQVNALLRAGLVERVPDPDGAVAKVLSPTRKGSRPAAPRPRGRAAPGRCVWSRGGASGTGPPCTDSWRS